MSTQADYKVIIAGTGFSGIGMGVKLKEAGYEDFLIIERADEVGGTWRDNHYPGCACDVPSHLYSFSFEQNPDWSRRFSVWSEIGQYLRDTTRKYGLYPHIKFNTSLKAAYFDEASGLWTVETSKGTFTANHVISAVGPLSNPAIPKIKGMRNFKGKTFHSATWDHNYDLKGKKVAVIGTGASAIQFVPEIAKEVAELNLFQRTAPWVVPKPDRAFLDIEKKAFRHVPLWQKATRASIYWSQELFLNMFLSTDSRLGPVAESLSKAYARLTIKDPVKRAKVIPDYSIGCKRLLLSSNYFPALGRDNVNIVTDGIEKVTADSVITKDGSEHKVDAIIFGTGFQVSEPMMGIEVKGLNGKDLRETWGETGFESYLGTTIAGFPNLYTLAGTNTGIGHTSLVFMIESQVNYIMQALRKMDHQQIKYLDVRQSVQDSFNVGLQQKMEGTVWTSGCNSWYLADTGKNFTIWPDFTYKFWNQTRRIDLSHYNIVHKSDDELITDEAVLGDAVAA